MSLASCSTGGAAATWTPPFCTVVAADTSNFSYLSCPLCQRALPDRAVFCFACGQSAPAPARLYRLLLSVATRDRVFPVVLFDRAARELMGCSADELSRLFAAHPGADRATAEALCGAMCRMTFRAPRKSAAADRTRAVSVVPLRDGFRPVIDTLRMRYPRR